MSLRSKIPLENYSKILYKVRVSKDTPFDTLTSFYSLCSSRISRSLRKNVDLLI